MSIFSYSHLMKDAVDFEFTAQIARHATEPHDQDAWTITIKSPYGRTLMCDYRTGTGLRIWPADANRVRPSVYDWCRSRPKTPTPESVLSCIGQDYITTRDLPLNTADALEYLASQFGYVSPGEAYRCLEALRAQHTKVTELLKGSGIDPDHFAEYCAGLE